VNTRIQLSFDCWPPDPAQIKLYPLR